MLTLNYNSWFMRKYLGYGLYHNPPESVCELARVIIGMTLLYLVASAGLLILAGLWLTGFFGLLYAMFTSATLTEVFNLGVETFTWANASWLTFLVFNSLLLGFGLHFAYNWLKEYRNVKRSKELHEYFTQHGEYPNTDSPITGIVKGIWDRIHSKTCTLIKWENDPLTLRAKKEEEENRRWAERRAKAAQQDSST